MPQDNNPDDDNPDMPEENDPLAPEPENLYEQQDPLAAGAAPGDDSAAQIEALEAQLAEAKDHMLRAVAEAENTRKRLLREREDVRKYAVSDFAKDLLDFSDNFHRALASIPEETKNDELIRNVLAGIEAMEKELLKTMERHGIQKIEPLDEAFNPNFHEAMFEAPGTGKAAGTIVEIIEPGYILHDRLLRPARVGIAKAEDGTPRDPGGRVDTQA